MAECDICNEKFTNKLRFPIKCDNKNCRKDICLSCFRHSLLMDGSKQECLYCNEPISTEFIYMHTSKSFRNEYLKKVIKLDIVKERALLKATQERLYALERCKLLKSRCDSLSIHLKKWNDEEISDLLKASQDEFSKQRTILDKSDEEINKISTSFFCPDGMCTGLVKNGRCNECKKMICSKCREERRNDEHECNKDQLESIKLLKRDTKPCPCCKTPIYKIDGCDQMFCVKCKTAFSWRTLIIHKGLIHNPHYNEYIAGLNNGNVPILGDDPCDLELNQAMQDLVKSQIYKTPERQNVTIRAMINNRFLVRVMNEINAILPILANNVHDDETLRHEKRKLREKYLRQRVYDLKRADTNWFKQLCLVYKRRELKKDLIKLIELFDRGLKDCIILGYRNKDYRTMFDQIGNLISYFNVQLEENKQRHCLNNKTKLSIDHGMQCGLIRY